MPFDVTALLACLTFGAALGALGYTGRDYVAGGLDFVERDLTRKLRRLRAPTGRLRTYLVVWLIVLGVAFFGIWLGLDSPVFAALIVAMVAATPWYLVSRMAEKRRMKIENQLADAMVTVANAVKAGLSLAQAMEILSTQCPRPINAEFHQIVAEYKLGKPLEQTLTEAKERLQSENFSLFTAAVFAGHQSGGRLNETVERIAQSVLEMQRLERKVNSETAQARKSAVYMAMAPAFILAAYYFVEPKNTTLLFTTTVGQVLLATAVVLNIVAYLWARWILNPNI